VLFYALSEQSPDIRRGAIEISMKPFDSQSQEADRGKIEQEEQSFFKQKGFVTDSMPEVDASAELKRTAEQAKIREDEHERRHGG
jgi:hypothetical protein